MYLVIYTASGETKFDAIDDKDKAVGVAVRKKGYVIIPEFPKNIDKGEDE